MTACGSCRSRGRTERVHRSLENAHDAFPTATTGIPNVLPMCRRQKVLPMSWRRALKAGRYVDVKNALAAVNAQLPAVGQHHPLEPDDLLAVRELVADARDHVARPDRRLGPAVRLHAVDGRATD